MGGDTIDFQSGRRLSYLKIRLFRDVIPRQWPVGSRRSRETYFLHLQGPIGRIFRPQSSLFSRNFEKPIGQGRGIVSQTDSSTMLPWKLQESHTGIDFFYPFSQLFQENAGIVLFTTVSLPTPYHIRHYISYNPMQQNCNDKRIVAQLLSTSPTLLHPMLILRMYEYLSQPFVFIGHFLDTVTI